MPNDRGRHDGRWDQREWLRQFAKAVAKTLQTRGLARLSLARTFPVIVAPYTDGWYIEIGDLELPSCRFAGAFLDNFSTGEGQSRRIWVGIFARGIPRARAIASSARKLVGPFKELVHDDFRVHRGVWYMRQPLPAADFGTPILELFEDGVKDFGIFYPGKPSFRRKPPRKLVAAATRFLERTLVSLDNFVFRLSASGSTPPKPFNNKTAIVTTTVIARSSRQAADAKARDRYTCRLCRSRPEDRYGAEGRSCLEAHHVKALHSRPRESRVTRLRDLVTVCANCHRVLTRLGPDERGFKQLQRRFARGAAKRTA